MDNNKPNLASGNDSDSTITELHRADSDYRDPNDQSSTDSTKYNVNADGSISYSPMPGLEFVIKDMGEQTVVFQRPIGEVEAKLSKTENKELFSIGPMNGQALVLQGLTNQPIVRDILTSRLAVAELAQLRKVTGSQYVSSSKSTSGDGRRSKVDSKTDR